MNIPEHPLVSIIVPVYNVERYLNECMNSIRKQTYQHLQIIVVEDCSTDDSLRILKSHMVDPRISLFRHECNSGLSAARNTGIDVATGDYLMFVDSDDVVDARLVETCISCVLQTKADVVTYDFIPFKDGAAIQDQPLGEINPWGKIKLLGDAYFKLPHFAWLKFIRKDLLSSGAVRFPVGLCYEDWPFHWRLGVAAENTYQIGWSLYHYRQRDTSITGSTGYKLLDLFSVQALVIECMRTIARPEPRASLSNKVWDSHWSVLTRIDPELLPVALTKAKESAKSMRAGRFVADMAWRRYLIATVVRFPRVFSLILVRLLRRALGVVSLERRRAAAHANL